MNSQFMKKGSHLFLASSMLFSSLATFVAQPPMNAQAAEETTIDFRTTLKDRTTKADRLTFDIWASDKATGTQIAKENLTVTNNGKVVGINWHDAEKTSYTLDLTTGKNTIQLQVKNGTEILTKSFTVIQVAANNGETIGDFVFSLDTFALGTGYLIEPQRISITKGLNSAQILDTILKNNNYSYKSTGNLESGFYLAHIMKEKEVVLERDNIKIPSILKDVGSKMAIKIDATDYANNKSLGEFDFSRGSGWMYSVNNVFPNVGFSDNYPQDEDIMRTQFTLLYGSDLGGGMIGANAFEAFSKDEATRALAYLNSSEERNDLLQNKEVKEAYNELLEEIQVINPQQQNLDTATGQLDGAVIEWAQETTKREKNYLADYTPEQKQFLENKEDYELQVAKLKAADKMESTDVEDFRLFKEKLDVELAPNEQKLLSNYTKLQAIITRYNELSKDLPLAQSLKENISKLPKIDNLQLSDEDQVKSLRSVYEKLQETSKKAVTNLQVLEAAEKKIEALVERKNLVEDIAKIPPLETISNLNINTNRVTYEKINNQVNDLLKTFEAIGYAEDENEQAIISAEQYEITNYQKLADSKTELLQLEQKYTFGLFKELTKIKLPQLNNNDVLSKGFYTDELIGQVETAAKLRQQVPKSMTSIYDTFRLYTYFQPEAKDAENQNEIIHSKDFKNMRAWEKNIALNPNALEEFFDFRTTYIPKNVGSITEYKKLYDYLETPEKDLEIMLEQFKKLNSEKQKEFLIKNINQLIENNKSLSDMKERYNIQLLLMCYDSYDNKSELTHYVEKVTILASTIATYVENAPHSSATHYSVNNWDNNFDFKNYFNFMELKKYVEEMPTIQKKYMTEDAKKIIQHFEDKKAGFKAKFTDYESDVYYETALKRNEVVNIMYYVYGEGNLKKYFSLWNLNQLEQATKILGEFKAEEAKFKGNSFFEYYNNPSPSNPNGIFIEYTPYAATLSLNESNMAALVNYKKEVNSLPSLNEVTLENKVALNEKILVAEGIYKKINSSAYRSTIMGEDVTLYNVKKRLIDLEKSAAVIEQINTLPSIEQLKNTDVNNYEVVQIAYNALTVNQKEMVANIEKLNGVAEFFKEIQTAQHIDSLIATLPNTITINNEAVVEEVKTLYTELTENGKKLVTSYQKFQLALEQLTSIRNIKNVNTLFSTMPELDKIVEADQLRVRQARAAYDALTASEKAQIIGLQAFINVEKALQDLNSSTEIVQKVEALIGAIPAIENITSVNKEQIEEARQAYSALTNTQKLRVKNEESLTRAEEQLVKVSFNPPSYIATPDEMMEMITKLPTIEKLTLEDGMYIQILMNYYEMLSKDAQAQIMNNYQLFIINEAYDKLQAQATNTIVVALMNKIALLPTLTTVDLSDEPLINKIRNEYNQLNKEQQQQVTNIQLLVQLEQQMSNFHTTVFNVKQQISQLANLAQITEENRSAIELTRRNYEMLLTTQKQLITNIALLEDVEQKFASLQLKSTNKVIEGINQLRDEILLIDEAEILKVRQAYEALSTQQKIKITNYLKLQNAEGKLKTLLQADEKIAKNVVALINDLPLIIKKTDAVKIQLARQTYSKLSYSQQLFVANIEALENAEAMLNSLTEYDRSHAMNVSNLINHLPIYAEVRIQDKKQITAVRTAYNALTSEQKKYVNDYSVLVKLEATLALLIKRQAAIKKEDLKLSLNAFNNTLKTITGTVTPGAKVYIYKGNKKITTATVSKTGVVRGVVPQQKAGTVLKVLIYNEVGDKIGQRTITVKSKKIAQVKSTTATAKKVSGKGPKNTKVYIYKGNKKIATGKIAANGKYSITISKQKRGSLLKVIVADNYGNKSAAKIVTVK